MSVTAGSAMKLQDFAQVVRSKNAGPRRFTLDVIFRSDADYQRAAKSEALTAEKIAPLYGVPASAVTVIGFALPTRRIARRHRQGRVEGRCRFGRRRFHRRHASARRARG